MIYLDHAATSFPKPQAVSEAITELLNTMAVNPGRGGAALTGQLNRRIQAFRAQLASHYGAADPNAVIFTQNCTDALNLAIHGYLKPIVDGSDHYADKPHVITTTLEHNSVLRPLYDWQDNGLINLTILKVNAQGRLTLKQLKSALNHQTRLVVITHVSNTLGIEQPVKDIGHLLRDFPRVRFLVDGAQSAGRIPLLMKSWGVDMLAMAGHKAWRGPTGIGALLLGDGMFDDDANCLVHPTRQGGTGGDSVSKQQPVQMPAWLESGTLNTVGIIGWASGFATVMQEGMYPNQVRERDLILRLVKQIRGLPRLKILGPLGDCNFELTAHQLVETGLVGGVLMFEIEGESPDELEAILDSAFQIMTRAGLHCAPLAHEAWGRAEQGAVRVSFGAENTEADVDTLVSALREIVSA